MMANFVKLATRSELPNGAGSSFEVEGSPSSAILVGDGVAIVEGARERLRELVASFPPEEP